MKTKFYKHINEKEEFMFEQNLTVEEIEFCSKLIQANLSEEFNKIIGSKKDILFENEIIIKVIFYPHNMDLVYKALKGMSR